MKKDIRFLGEPEEWFYDQYDYLYDQAINNNFNDIPLQVKVYFILRVLFDEVMNGGFGQYISNSSKELTKYSLECAKCLGNESLLKLIEKFNEIDLSKELSHESAMKLEKLSMDFYDIEDEIDLYDFLDNYYIQNNK